RLRPDVLAGAAGTTHEVRRAVIVARAARCAAASDHWHDCSSCTTSADLGGARVDRGRYAVFLLSVSRMVCRAALAIPRRLPGIAPLAGTFAFLVDAPGSQAWSGAA